MTRQHLMIDVPSPPTRLKVGLHALSDGQDGFSVGTDGHVWLTALDGSTFSAHSQGALRAISADDSIYTAAKVGVSAATTGGTTIAATGGVKIIAGYDAQPGLQSPDESIESPPSADDVSAGCDEVATAWGIADTVVAGLFNAETLGLAMLKGPVTARTFLDYGNVITTMGFASNLAAMATNAAGMGGAAAAGVNIHAKGGINICTPAFCSMYGMAGLLFASPFAVQLFGAATTGIVGLASAGMSSLGKVDLASSKGITVEAHGEVKVSSDPGEVVLKGTAGLNIGQVVLDPGNKAQGTTMEVGFDAVTGMRVGSPGGEVRFGRLQEDVPTETAASALGAAFAALQSSATAAATLKNGARTVAKVPAALKETQAPATDTTVTMMNRLECSGEAGFVATESITLAVGPWIVAVDADGITLGMGTTTPPVGPDGTKAAPVIEGAQIAMTADELAAKAGAVGGSLSMKSDAIEIKSEPMPGSVKIEADAISVKDFSLVTFA